MELTRRDFLRSALATGSALTLGPGLLAQTLASPSTRAAGQTPPASPNVILCMTDDQGWGDTSYNGLKTIRTEALDDMAASGLRMDRFYTASPVCSPTRGSVMTGRHPNRFGCFNWGYKLDVRETALPQVFKDAGYATGHFGKWHLSGDPRKAGNPVSADDPLHPGRFGFDEWLSMTNYFEANPTLSHKGKPVEFAGDGSEVIVAEALKFIRSSQQANRPFFVVIWFGNPHLPHAPTPELLKAAGGDAYYGEILGIDRAMGALRKQLRAMGLAQQTLVWFNSDNGADKVGSHGGLKGRKSTLYEGGIRVPGIVEWPGVIAPGRTQIPCGTVDIYPTVLDLAGIKAASQVQPLDGISLRPVIEGKMSDRPVPLGFWHAPKGPAKGAALQPSAGTAAWIDNRYKLHRIQRDQWQLHDLQQDAQEKVDLSARNPKLLAEMQEKLLAWQRSVIRSYEGKDYPQGSKA